ncbi:unnamed protein product, partial [Effrenium voratum]
DQVALRAFERICKGQGTEAAVKKLRDETPELWRETVMRFRDTKQAPSTGRVKFDTAKHLTVVRHSLAQEEEMEYRPMTCGEYIKHHMEKPPPFTLSETSALAAWYQDLKDEGVKKSERRMYNPKSKKEEIFTRVHVHTGEVERRKDIRERGQIVQTETTARDPDPSTVRDMTSRLSVAPPELTQILTSASRMRTLPSPSAGKKLTAGVSVAAQQQEHQRISTLLPRMEDLRGKMTAQLKESQALFKTAGKDHIESKAMGAMELLQSGVTEESINDMIISGADAYGLGPRKSVYKCAYQFM